MNDDDGYEYVIEKLAIRKVPISLIDESMNQDEKRKKALKRVQSSKRSLVSLSKEKSSEVVQGIIDCKSVCPPKQDSGNDPVKLSGTARVPKIDCECEMVCHILNDSAPISALNTKNVMSKEFSIFDPLKLTPKIIMPPGCTHRRLISLSPPQNQGRCCSRKFEHYEGANKPCAMIPSKKELSPELKETITALGFAQKPRIPGFPPKNKRHVDSSKKHNHKDEKMAHDVLKVDSNHQLTLASEPVLNKNQPVGKKFVHHNRPPVPNVNFEHFDCVPKSQPSGSYRKHAAAPFKAEVIDPDPNVTPCVSLGKLSNDDSQISPQNAAGNNTPIDSQRVTEMNQLKGPSLKWKIIIKHHTDKSKKDAGNTNNEEW